MRLSDTARRMMWVLCISLPVIIAGGAVYHFYHKFSFMPFALGAALGTALNIAKVIMIDRAVKKIVNMDSVKAGNYVRSQHLLRFLLTGIVLVLTALIPFINLWGAAIGVLVYPIALYFLRDSHARKPKQNDIK